MSNELDPPIQTSWLTTIFSFISCRGINSAATVHPYANSGLTELHSGGLLYRSAAPDTKKVYQNSYQETYKTSYQTSSDDKVPSFSGDLKMHDFDHGPDGGGTCA